MNWHTPDLDACVTAPPSSCWVTSSPVTVFTTSGPVMNMYDVPSTMNTKSVMAGLYTAPPAHRPMITPILGGTPGDCTFREKNPPQLSRLTTPSLIRAPAPALQPMGGAPPLR